MIVVHHLNSSHSYVIIWLLEELGLEYEIVNHQREATGRSPDTLRLVHPAARAPTIEHHGRAMVESTGIILYLLDAGGGRLRPRPDTADAMVFYQWLTFIEGSAKAPLMQLVRMMHLPADDAGRTAVEALAREKIGLIERALEGVATIVPSMFTAADMQLAFFEEIMAARLPMEEWPNMNAHRLRMRQRDGYRRAEQRGGPLGLRQLFASLGAGR